MPRPLQIDRWPFDVEKVSKSRGTWATSVPILVFLGLSVVDLSPMYVTYRQTGRQTDVKRTSSLNAPLP